MTYLRFRDLARKLTDEQLRCDVRPTKTVISLVEILGLHRYERFVLRLIHERTAARAAQ